jgi:RNA polymerase sigma-70 factor (ECF subfamily)
MEHSTERAGMKSAAAASSAEIDQRWSGLMVAAQAGDRTAYETLLRDCVPLVKRVARRAGVQPDRLDDVVQDVLITLHRARQTYDPNRSFSAWLSVIAQRRAIDSLRHHGRQDRREVFSPIAFENHPDETPGPDSGWQADRRPREIDAALAELPPGQREAVEHLAIRQLSLADAANLTGKSTGALKVNLHRALKALRARFGRDT